MATLIQTLQRYPELALFLVLALGYVVGTWKYKGFGLGSVVGTLVVALVVGQAHIEIPAFTRTVFFALFMFAIGYQTGPQFFSGLKKGGLQLMVMSLVFSVTGLAAVLVMAKVFAFDKGFAAGLLSGALTQSSAIGTATDAIAQLNLAEDVKQKLASHVPIGDAVTYIFGTLGVTLFLVQVVPRLLRFNLKTECDEQEKELRGGEEPAASGVLDAYIAVDVQAFRLTEKYFVGETVRALEVAVGREGKGVYVQRLRRGRRLITPPATQTLRAGDIVVLSGDRELLLGAQPQLGESIVDKQAMDMPFAAVTVIVTNKAAVGKSLRELGKMLPDPRGVHLRRVLRQGQEIPHLPNTRLERGDVLEVSGERTEIERLAPSIGFVNRPSDTSDVPFMGLAIVVGTLVGMLSLRLGPVAVSLGTSGGVLVAGLGFGWFHSIRPQWGRIPTPTVWFLQTVGLNTFIAAVGISAGPHALAAMKSNGLQLLAAGVVVSLVPHLVTALFGRFVLKMNGGLLLGACAGAGTVTAALPAACEAAESQVPALAYTIPYALSNVVLTAWGPLVVALVS
jgi:putative transport protein